MSNQIQERNVICPYCGAEDNDSWERREECGDEECWDCGKKFRWNRDCRVTYDTKQLCEQNEIEHDWKYFDHTTDSTRPDLRCKGKRCENCDEYVFDREEKDATNTHI